MGILDLLKGTGSKIGVGAQAAAGATTSNIGKALLGGVGAVVKAIEGSAGVGSTSAAPIKEPEKDRQGIEIVQKENEQKTKTSTDLPDAPDMDNKKVIPIKIDQKDDFNTSLQKLADATAQEITIVKSDLSKGFDYLHTQLRRQNDGIGEINRKVEDTVKKNRINLEEINRLKKTIASLSLAERTALRHSDLNQDENHEGEENKDQQGPGFLSGAMTGAGLLAGARALKNRYKNVKSGTNKLSKFGKTFGRVAGPLSGVLSGGAEYMDSGDLTKSLVVGAGSAIGTIGGGALGTLLGPLGTIAGGIGGGIAGESIARSGYEWLFGGPKKDENKDPQELESDDNTANLKLLRGSMIFETRESDFEVIAQRHIKLTAKDTITISAASIIFDGDVSGLTGERKQQKQDANKPKSTLRMLGEGLGILQSETPTGDRIPGIFGRLMGQQVSPGEIPQARNEAQRQSQFTGAVPSSATPGALYGKNGVASQQDMEKAVDDMLKMNGATVGKDREALRQYMKSGGVGLDPATNAWCAAFVNAALGRAGIQGSGSNIATSYLNWGRSLKENEGVRKGDVMVLARGHSAGQTGGHVGVSTGETKTVNGRLYYGMISGNTGGRVATDWRAADTVSVRRAMEPDSEQAQAAKSKQMQPGETPNAQQSGTLDKTSFEKTFKGSPLEGQYDSVVSAAKKYGMDPSLVASIMAHETGKGSNVKGNNPGGIMDPATNWQRKKQFSSLDEGIDTTARTIAKNFIRAGGDMGRLSNIYAPKGAANDPGGLNKHWLPGVIKYLQSFGGSSEPNSMQQNIPAARKDSEYNYPGNIVNLTGPEQARMKTLESQGIKFSEPEPEQKSWWDKTKEWFTSTAERVQEAESFRPELTKVDPAIKDYGILSPNDQQTTQVQNDMSKFQAGKAWDPPAPTQTNPSVWEKGTDPIKYTGDEINKSAFPKGIGKPTRPTYNPEQMKATPGNNGYGERHDPDGVGLCSI